MTQVVGQNDFYLINNTNCDVDARLHARNDPACPTPSSMSLSGNLPSTWQLCPAMTTTLVYNGGGGGEWSRIVINYPGAIGVPYSYDGDNDSPTGTVDCISYQVHVEWDNCSQARVEY